MQNVCFFLRNKYICIPQLDPEKVSALEKVKNSLIYMENNYNKPMELHEVAAQSCISIYNFCRMFKAATEHTFVEYLIISVLKNLKSFCCFQRIPLERSQWIPVFQVWVILTEYSREKNGVSPLVYRKQNCTKK